MSEERENMQRIAEKILGAAERVKDEKDPAARIIKFWRILSESFRGRGSGQ
jgi:hypothetical protein